MCKKFDTVVLIDPTFIDYYSNKMVFAKLNGKEADSLTAKAYNIKGYPTFVLANSKGEEIDRIIGFKETDEFIETIENYKKGIGTLNDLLAKAEGSEDRTLFLEIADKYKYRGASEDALPWFQKVINIGDAADSLSRESRFSIADMMLRNKDYEGAIDSFKSIKNDFKGMPIDETASIYIPYAMMKNSDTAAAIIGFKKFINDFPKSEDVEYAEKKINELKGIKEE